MLMQQEANAAPIQSHTQGLASMLRQGLAGYMQGQDARQQEAAMEAMTQGMAQSPQPMPSGVAGPPAMGGGGIEGMIASQQGMNDNPYAQRNLQSLLMQKMGQEQAAKQAELARTQGMEDFEKQLKLKQKYTSAPKPPTDVQAYQFARTPEGGSFTGSFPEYKAMTRATIERAPSGYTKTPTGLVPLPGGPADPTVEPKRELPQIEADAAQTTRLIDELITHPGMEGVVGMPDTVGGAVYKLFGATIPGTDESGFMARLDQIGGKQFLQAFESLKGGGQITEIEGKKATEAMSRLTKTGQTEIEYRKAAQELKDVIQLGVDRAQRAAGQVVPPNMLNDAFSDPPPASGWSIKKVN